MSKKYQIYVILGFTAFILSGCDAHRLSGLNSEFTGVYQEKTELSAGKLDGLPVLASESVQAQFAQIASAANKAADDLSLTDKTRLRIGFRRLAALASWQAAAEKDDPTLSLQSAGIDDCKKDSNYIRSPRDCLMIDYVGALAANDATVRNMHTKLREAAGVTIYPKEYLVIFKDMHDNFRRYFDDLKTITVAKKPQTTTLVPAAFWDAIARQTLLVYCNARTAAVYYGETDGTPTNIDDSNHSAKLIVSLTPISEELNSFFPDIQYNGTGCIGLGGGQTSVRSPT